MADSVVIAEAWGKNAGYKFSWGLAIGGGVIATAVTFVLLTLGAGFGLLLASAHHSASAPTLLTGGAIYFFVAQAFGFATGGHFAGRLLGPLIETQMQEDIRAGAHALVAWAVAVLASFILVCFAGLAASSNGSASSSLYGSEPASSLPVNFFVDTLFDGSDAERSEVTRAEAARILDADIANGVLLPVPDHDRLVSLVSRATGLSRGAAVNRVDAVQADLVAKTSMARKTASYTSLWIAFSLLFGAVVAMGAAVSARIEDDRQTPATADVRI